MGLAQGVGQTLQGLVGSSEGLDLAVGAMKNPWEGLKQGRQVIGYAVKNPNPLAAEWRMDSRGKREEERPVRGWRGGPGRGDGSRNKWS